MLLSIVSRYTQNQTCLSVCWDLSQQHISQSSTSFQRFVPLLRRSNGVALQRFIGIEPKACQGGCFSASSSLQTEAKAYLLAFIFRSTQTQTCLFVCWGLSRQQISQLDTCFQRFVPSIRRFSNVSLTKVHRKDVVSAQICRRHRFLFTMF